MKGDMDGRFAVLMLYSERLFWSVFYSWWGEDGSWLRMFRNARV